jgi:hypothetical protein
MDRHIDVNGREKIGYSIESTKSNRTDCFAMKKVFAGRKEPFGSANSPENILCPLLNRHAIHDPSMNFQVERRMVRAE